ncbi:YbaB/EbfC family nucleoid-associated protein [Candidatus Puniceispirillum sp.]|nr:YbaB/EbfC family nucleoid-associated protein [Candidatus Puniceispirillum sp.]
MRNIVGMMNKVQEMQDQLKVMQGDLAAMEFTALVGNGVVSATVTGNGKLTKLKLDPNTLRSGDTKMLADMICLATNNAHDQATDEKARMMKQITGDLPLPPGMNLPF